MYYWPGTAYITKYRVVLERALRMALARCRSLSARFAGAAVTYVTGSVPDLGYTFPDLGYIMNIAFLYIKY